jgi:hypothetical protein
MAKTYTYTARSADDPAQVITFTLYNHALSIGPGTPEQISPKLWSTAPKAGPGVDNLPAAWLKTVALLKESNCDRITLMDTETSIVKDSLRLVIWSRSHKRHWSPITIVMEHVDNLDAARAFVKELNRRKISARRRERFFGFLGARIAWFIVGTFITSAAMISLRSRHS